MAYKGHTVKSLILVLLIKMKVPSKLAQNNLARTLEGKIIIYFLDMCLLKFIIGSKMLHIKELDVLLFI